MRRTFNLSLELGWLKGRPHRLYLLVRPGVVAALKYFRGRLKDRWPELILAAVEITIATEHGGRLRLLYLVAAITHLIM